MSQTMLQLVQQVTAELNLAVPTYVAGNTSQDVQQVLALMNATGYEPVKEYDWQALQVEYRFYTDAVTFVGDTVSNQSYNIIVTGNATADSAAKLRNDLALSLNEWGDIPAIIPMRCSCKSEALATDSTVKNLIARSSWAWLWLIKGHCSTGVP